MTQTYKTMNLPDSEKEVIYKEFFEDYYNLLKEHNHYCYRKTGSWIKQLFSEDDILQDLSLKFLEKDLIIKYDKSTTLTYFIAVIVKRHYIDLQRKYLKRRTVSLDKEFNSDSTDTLVSIIPDKVESENRYITKILAEEFIEKLPDVNLCTLDGYHSEYGHFRLTAQTLAKLLMRGYSAQDIAECFYNPVSKKSISVNRIRAYIKDLKTYITYHGLILQSN